MKKVLALVLAVIMVCTMAMAVQVGGTTVATENDANANPHYRPITPGNAIIFDRDELGLADDACVKTDGKFDPDKNKVAISFDKGSDLIASYGWVKTTETDPYKYVIMTKANETAVLDDTADIIISKVEVTKYGINGTKTYTFSMKDDNGVMKYTYGTTNTGNNPTGINEVYDANGNNLVGGWRPLDTTDAGEFFLVFNYGRTGADFNIGTSTPTAGNVLYTVKKVAGGKASKAYAVLAATDANGANASYTLAAGEKVIFSATSAYDVTKLTKALQSEIITNDVTVKGILENGVVPNKAVKITVNNQKAGAALYMVNADGTLTNLGAKFDDNGVLTATAKITGAVILTDKAMTASNVITPGTTTNPGTGANDVVGVAAALAVVALVSGAAISLKK